jgi:hydrogenase nickel incorporation protein HypA/HybF
MADHGGGRLAEVRVAVGELTAIEPELLEYAWESLVAGSPDSGARLVVEWRQAGQFCPVCGTAKERSAGSWLRVCPDCSEPLRIEGGDELDIVRVEFNPLEENVRMADGDDR